MKGAIKQVLASMFSVFELALNKKRKIIEWVREAQLRHYYHIDYIDIDAKVICVTERGMSLYLRFDDLYDCLFMISRMSKRDIFLFAFVYGLHGIYKHPKLNEINSFDHDRPIILEGEDRIGRFKIFDILQRNTRIVTIEEIFFNIDMMQRISHYDIFRIGMLSSKNKITMEIIIKLFKSKIRVNSC